MKRTKAKFRVGQKAIVHKLPVRVVRREKHVLWVAMAGFEFPCFPDELRPLTAREIGPRPKRRKL